MSRQMYFSKIDAAIILYLIGLHQNLNLKEGDRDKITEEAIKYLKVRIERLEDKQ